MPSLTLKPTHKAVTAYYESLAKFEKFGIKHEGAVRSAFCSLSASTGERVRVRCRHGSSARQFDWKRVPEYQSKGKSGNQMPATAADSLI